MNANLELEVECACGHLRLAQSRLCLIRQMSWGGIYANIMSPENDQRTEAATGPFHKREGAVEWAESWAEKRGEALHFHYQNEAAMEARP